MVVGNDDAVMVLVEADMLVLLLTLVLWLLCVLCKKRTRNSWELASLYHTAGRWEADKNCGLIVVCCCCSRGCWLVIAYLRKKTNNGN